MHQLVDIALFTAFIAFLALDLPAGARSCPTDVQVWSDETERRLDSPDLRAAISDR